MAKKLPSRTGGELCAAASLAYDHTSQLSCHEIPNCTRGIGHHPFEGQRRALQMNWMTGEGSKGFHALRHRLSAAIKTFHR